MTVLDLGVGSGAFVFSSYEHLIQRGATAAAAQTQIYGAEIHGTAYKSYLEQARKNGLTFPHVQLGDFFDMEFPRVDAIVGNPPYVRRTYLDNVDEIRNKVLSQPLPANITVRRHTDLYVYFLLHALARLKVGGRLAVITADSWLTAGYGDSLRKYLQEHFAIECLVSLDRRIFDDAEVKPVLLLATKTEQRDDNRDVSFIRLKDGLPITRVTDLLSNPAQTIPQTVVTRIRVNELAAEAPWAVHFRAPALYEELASHRLMTPMANLAETRVGIQTLAKEFFVLTAEQAAEAGIEQEYLAPLAQSPRLFSMPVIAPGTTPKFYLFYCAKPRTDLSQTRALDYIEAGERASVPVRGKNRSVTGYQNKERIQQASRKHWYDLQSKLERRGRAEILIPRLLYRTFTVVWNQASFVPGELFIEFLPFPLPAIATEVYLAILTSSLTEIMIRVHAQVYGGGTYNINPGEIKQVPILNAVNVSDEQQEQLVHAYRQYLADDQHSRTGIDTIIYRILGFTDDMQQKLDAVLQDLVRIATTAKRFAQDLP